MCVEVLRHYLRNISRHNVEGVFGDLSMSI
jgi:hypothetical protein